MRQIVKIAWLFLFFFCEPVLKNKIDEIIQNNTFFKLFLKQIFNNLMIRKDKVILYIVKLVHKIFFHS